LARFQKAALASGVVAIDISPIPPARASGEIRKNGTAVDTILMEPVCADNKFADIIAVNKKQPNRNVFFILRILMFAFL
jgi:hypothetical protein